MSWAVDTNSLRIAPLTRAHADDIVTWVYDPPYGIYDLTSAEPEDLLDSRAGFHAVLADDRLVGFRSFGADGQVPGWAYDGTALDTGGGVRPELTGRGLGRAVIETGLAFGRVHFAPSAFRVTVAAFNTRALRVVRPLGFEPVGRFVATHESREFEVLVRTESWAFDC